MLLILGLLASSLVFTACGEDPRATAIEQAFAQYPETHPQVYRLDVGNLNELLKDREDAETLSLTVPATVLDPSKLTSEQLLPNGALELTTDVTTITDDTYGQLRAETRAKAKELATALADAPTTTVDFPVTLSRDAEGEWAANIDSEIISKNYDQALVTKLMVSSPAWTIVAAKVSDHAWKSELIPDALATITDNIEVGSISLASPATDQVNVEFFFPDPIEAYTAAAETAFEAYNSQKSPIFNSIREADFENKMRSSDSTLTADLQQGIATLTVNPRTAVLPIAEIDKAELAQLVADTHEFEVSAVSGTPTVQLDQTLKDIIKPKLDKLNSEKVVKKQKLPSSKVVQGKSSGTLVKIVSKGSPDRVITFKKGDKVQLKVMVRAKKSVSVRLPAGNYTLNFGSGKDWYGPKYTYGPTGSYTKSTMTIKSYPYYHTLTINTTGGNMGSSSTPYEY